MNRRVKTTWQSILGGLLACCLAGPAAAQQFAGNAKVIEDGAPVRAGAGTSFYTVGEMAVGTIVQIDDKIFDWYKIAAPPGVYSYIRKEAVDLSGDGKTGTVNADRTPIKAAGLDGPGKSYRRQMHLFKGNQVTLAESEPDGAYYRIMPPKGARVYIHVAAVKRLDVASGDAPDAVAAPPAEPALKPAENDRPVPQQTQVTTTVTPPQPTPPASQPQATTVPPVPPKLVQDEAADPPDLRQGAVVLFESLERRFAEAREMPLEQQPLDVLLEAYAAVSHTAELTVAQQRTVQLRIYKLQSNVQLAAALTKLTKAVRGLESTPQTPPAAPQRPAQAPPAKYDAVGQLLASSVYDGVSLPRLYRLVTPGWQTSAYVRPTSAIAPMATLGRVVGAVGTWRYDPALKLRVLEATRLDVLEPQPAGKIVGEQAEAR